MGCLMELFKYIYREKHSKKFIETVIYFKNDSDFLKTYEHFAEWFCKLKHTKIVLSDSDKEYFQIYDSN